MYQKIVRYLWIGFGGSIGGFVLLLFAVYYNLGNLFGNLPDLNELDNPRSEIASVVYAQDDSTEIGKYFRENRSNIRYEDLSANLINALLASEDIRFEEHSGIDMIGVMAIPYYLVRGRKRGSSTLTQQLAKNLFKTRRKYDGILTKTILNLPLAKLKEWIVAVKLERSYTKREIMTMYLNTVEFGSNASGIKAAAKTFFNTDPRSLNIQQSAILVGLLQAPSYYNPVNHPDRAKDVRNKVIAQMEKYEFINEPQRDSISELPIITDEYEVEGHNTGLATYFRSEIRKELLQFCEENGYDLFSDGLKIYTTLDPTMQAYAEEAITTHMKKQQELFFEHWKGRNPWIDEEYKEIKGFLENVCKKSERYRALKEKFGNDTAAIGQVMRSKVKMRVFTWETANNEKDTLLSPIDSIRYYKHFLNAGFMCLDPNNGHIKAWVGGINHKYFKYDHVRQGMRQPGSTFKPILYTAAIDAKFHPCFKIVDAPVTFSLPEGGTYTPKNSGSYSGATLTLRQAMAQSINTAAAYLVRELTPDRMVEYAEDKFGFKYLRDKYHIKSKLDRVPAICLGTSDVSVFELVSAYGAFVNGGVWTEPIFITRIEDKNGKVLKRYVPKTIEAFSEETAYLMTYMLRGSSEEKDGTALGLLRYKFRQGNEVGGKTGTTSNYSDAWFMGITKDLAAGVWVGGDDRSIHFRSIEYGQGARQAMPAYALFMEKVMADPKLSKIYTKGAFPKPSTPLSIQLDCSKYEQFNPNDSSGNYMVPEKVKDDDIL